MLCRLMVACLMPASNQPCTLAWIGCSKTPVASSPSSYPTAHCTHPAHLLVPHCCHCIDLCIVDSRPTWTPCSPPLQALMPATFRPDPWPLLQMPSQSPLMLTSFQYTVLRPCPAPKHPLYRLPLNPPSASAAAVSDTTPPARPASPSPTISPTPSTKTSQPHPDLLPTSNQTSVAPGDLNKLQHLPGSILVKASVEAGLTSKCMPKQTRDVW